MEVEKNAEKIKPVGFTYVLSRRGNHTWANPLSAEFLFLSSRRPIGWLLIIRLEIFTDFFRKIQPGKFSDLKKKITRI
jgi:hypothetical protein